MGVGRELDCYTPGTIGIETAPFDLPCMGRGSRDPQVRATVPGSHSRAWTRRLGTTPNGNPRELSGPMDGYRIQVVELSVTDFCLLLRPNPWPCLKYRCHISGHSIARKRASKETGGRGTQQRVEPALQNLIPSLLHGIFAFHTMDHTPPNKASLRLETNHQGEGAVCGDPHTPKQAGHQPRCKSVDPSLPTRRFLEMPKGWPNTTLHA